ncbi:MAG: glycosyl hydrolase family 2, partial [Rikenellaceae bacterium]|nr:glycosyl hydrolase family 2 [Rikenellaceae bacterium]
PAFLEEFARRRGYKFEEYLPEYLANDSTETSRRVISDYGETVNDILMDHFMGTWIDWAHAQGAGIRNQSHGSPGNLIDIYAMTDIPETETFGRTAFDIPGLQVDEGMRLNDSNPAVLKFASSAAHIAGKNLTSAETFTWLTEHFRTALSQTKPEIDQMFTSGVNNVFFHGSPYSPKEAEWPGWKFYASIDMSPTNNIWRHAPAFFDYIRRCQSFLQEGQPDNDFLLYFPIYDIWNDYRKGRYMTFTVHNLVGLLPEFNRTVSEIMDAGYDLDYISDRFIASLQVEKGELVTPTGTRYRALILPDTRIMPTETLEKILSLTSQGATVIFAGRYPEDVPG